MIMKLLTVWRSAFWARHVDTTRLSLMLPENFDYSFATEPTFFPQLSSFYSLIYIQDHKVLISLKVIRKHQLQATSETFQGSVRPWPTSGFPSFRSVYNPAKRKMREFPWCSWSQPQWSRFPRAGSQWFSLSFGKQKYELLACEGAPRVIRWGVYEGLLHKELEGTISEDGKRRK